MHTAYYPYKVLFDPQNGPIYCTTWYLMVDFFVPDFNICTKTKAQKMRRMGTPRAYLWPLRCYEGLALDDLEILQANNCDIYNCDGRHCF